MSEQLENPESKLELSNRFLGRKKSEIQPALDDFGINDVPNFID